MLYLKKINKLDVKKEYETIKKIPQNENGFENSYYNCSFAEFNSTIINKLLNYSQGINLPENYVPCTYYFLWDNDDIVGLFKIRHCLNEQLKIRGGHLGFCILKEFRGKGYGTNGLKLAIEQCKNIIKEDELYLSVLKNNVASLKVQLKNGARIVNETEDHYLTRIKLK